MHALVVALVSQSILSDPSFVAFRLEHARAAVDQIPAWKSVAGPVLFPSVGGGTSFSSPQTTRLAPLGRGVVPAAVKAELLQHCELDCGYGPSSEHQTISSV
jgi:hypothetical protein